MLIAAVPIIEALLAFANEVPSLVKAGETVMTLIREGRDPTAEEQALFDQALEDAVNATPQA